MFTPEKKHWCTLIIQNAAIYKIKVGSSLYYLRNLIIALYFSFFIGINKIVNNALNFYAFGLVWTNI